MQPFIALEGVAAPLDVDNVDTDMIIPKQFLKTVKRTGLGKNLFDEMRYAPDGSEIADFVLNKTLWRNSVILVSGKNFGCGSSREHAPWALLDFGIRCVVAQSFADIFYNNCFKNGILPVILPEAQCAELMATAQKGAVFVVNLQNQTLEAPNQDGSVAIHSFDIDPGRKKTLLEGLDDIAETLTREKDVDAFERQDKELRPWLYGRSDGRSDRDGHASGCASA
ncbi:MAG: 3-isopropylmalate dehydratase small subunit [Rickettsiales bacterium]